MPDECVVIAGAARTPHGSLQGQLSEFSATALGSLAIKSAVERAGISLDAPDEVFMGCVLPAGLGQAPARQASLGAGLPQSAGCTTVNKVCGSGMKSAMLAHDAILSGSAQSRDRGRHGEHVERAVSAEQSARRISPGPWFAL